MKDICADLAAEHLELDNIVFDLDEAGWNIMTPAEGWTVRDQIRHLAYFDDRARLAATDPDSFNQHVEDDFKDLNKFWEFLTNVGRDLTTAELMAWWRKEREGLLEALAPMDRKDRVPWYGLPMSALSHATARLMETWAHGQDVVDALNVRREPTDRLRHIAHLGVSTFRWTYLNRQMEVPDTVVRVELKSPAGELWTWGPEGEENVVSGPVLDFCLVVTQRRHIDDTYLETRGPVAEQWISLAQAFAGPPTNGRKAGMFPKK